MGKAVERFRIGNGVCHEGYGEGEIIAYADKTAYLVRFDSVRDRGLIRMESKELVSRPKRGRNVKVRR